MSTEEIKEAVEESWEALNEETRKEIEAGWTDVIERTDGARQISATEAAAEYISVCGWGGERLAEDDFKAILSFFD